MTVVEQGEDWQVQSPTYRFEIALEADLIEEIGRVYGYNRLPSVVLQGALDVQPLIESDNTIDGLCNVLVSPWLPGSGDLQLCRSRTAGTVLIRHLTPVPLANPFSSEMAGCESASGRVY